MLTVILLTLLGSWQPIDSEEGITSYQQDTPGSNLAEFRGEAVVAAPLQKVLWVLADNEHRQEWVDRLNTHTVLKRSSDFEYIVHQVFKMPAVISDREYVYRVKAYTADDGAAHVVLCSCDYPAPKTDAVRARMAFGEYVLIPIDAEHTLVTVEIHTDPRGWIPHWLVVMVQRSWPIKTLRGIRDQVQKPYAQMYPLPPLGDRQKQSCQDVWH